MADRYHDRAFPADGYDRGGDQRGAGRPEGDPLAELARLIGQTDTMVNPGRANPASPRIAPRESYPQQAVAQEEPMAPTNPPSWMQRANPREISRDSQREMPPALPSEEEYVASTHPLHRYGAQQHPDDHGNPQQDFAQDRSYQHGQHEEEHAFAEHEHEEELDPSRYDDALYGRLDNGAQGTQGFDRDPAYPDDPYAYQDGYEDEGEEPPVEKRRGGLTMVVAILALAIVGTGGAFAYRSYFSSARSGEPPIIRADNTPIKIMPTPPDGSAKVPDRLVSGDGAEKLVPREEAPVDVNANANSGGPRVVFPQLNANNNPPPPSSVAQNGIAAGGAPSNATLANGEPRRIRTLSVHGDQQQDASTTTATVSPPAPPPAAAKAAKGTKTARIATPPSDAANANASANQPLSLTPQSSPDQASAADTSRGVRIAATNASQDAAPADSAVGYLVQVSSQRSENDAQASFKALQAKFPNVLGSQTPVIKRADLGEKGIYFRAMVGPFGSSQEAGKFCGDLKTAGGQCIVQKN
ncbi:MAG: SPOR domain-containing protein [Bradyrhizobium sp.]|uniref:SPOR domain-containing protein n=1 Tax=Bradyrhizobium sp. TaxID=376 RepID=UPI001D2CEEBE|nr:SPOR domain-containing protein [Bradyrhizobium sp.]MBV9563211.1 SPOR domain-containing protein [Bradyrhizobium sp.]